MRQILMAIGLLMTLNLSAGSATNAIGSCLSDSIQLKAVIGEKLSGFEVDNLGYIYLLESSGRLKKLAPNGDSVGVFNDVRRFGKLYSMDVSNPLKVLLFYKDFGTIVVLDRFLNNRLTIDLRKKQIFQAKAIAQSFDNGVWVYDELEGKLKRLDDGGNLLGETVDFRVIFDDAPSPDFITDADRLVYLYDQAKGLFVLDYFGTLKNKVALLDWMDLQVIGNRVLGRKGSTLLRYVPGTLELKEQVVPQILEGADKVQVSMDFLYVLKEGKLHIYSL
ncbi:MAG TPA: hypothetical protein VIK80_03275 [Flavihumibacter sp.]